MNIDLNRVKVLMQLSQYSAAEKELRELLKVHSDSVKIRLCLCQCLSEAQKYEEASQEAELLLALEKNSASAYYAAAYIDYSFYLWMITNKNKVCLEKIEGAEIAIRKAIEIKKDTEKYLVLLAAILLTKGNNCSYLLLQTFGELITERKTSRDYYWEALTSVEKGLKINPYHSGCINLRALILQQLNEESTAEALLIKHNFELNFLEDLPNAATHFYLGKLLLKEGKYQTAKEHFQLAFYLDPRLEWARLGVLEAIKCQYSVYRWLSPTTSRGKFFVNCSVGLFFIGLITSLFNRGEILFPSWLMLLCFVYSPWMTIFPDWFNVILKNDTVASEFIYPKEIRFSYFINAVVAVFILIFSTIFINPLATREFVLVNGIVLSCLSIPFSVMLAEREKKQRDLFRLYIFALTIMALTGLVLFQTDLKVLGFISIYLSIIGCCFSYSLANSQIFVRNKFISR